MGLISDFAMRDLTHEGLRYFSGPLATQKNGGSNELD